MYVLLNSPSTYTKIFDGLSQTTKLVPIISHTQEVRVAVFIQFVPVNPCATPPITLADYSCDRQSLFSRVLYELTFMAIRTFRQKCLY